MEVYHASPSVVEHPDVQFSRPYLDFGPGFYITTILDQAQRYGERFIRRGKMAILNVYELDEDLSKWKVQKFPNYDDAWLDFVSKCRMGKNIGDYDIIMGGIANDKCFAPLTFFLPEISIRTNAFVVFCMRSPTIKYVSALNRQS